MSELFKRIIVALIGIPLAFFIILEGGYYLLLGIAVVSAMALYEFYGISEHKQINPLRVIPIAFGIILQFTLFYFINHDRLNLLFYVVLFELVIFLIIIPVLNLFIRNQHAINNLSVTFFGFLYVTILFSSIILIREFSHISRSFMLSEGAIAGSFVYKLTYANWGVFILLIFISVWICDSAAYFFGKAFGKHKLMPKVSPKKSWEGAIAGFFMGMLAYIGLNQYFLIAIPPTDIVIMGVLINVFCQIGDLIESQIKRDAGVKDSSAILPGHGGILDRFDGILFVMPAVFAYLVFKLLDI
jgi:phosphatidate cytidylyltransferase